MFAIPPVLCILYSGEFSQWERSLILLFGTSTDAKRTVINSREGLSVKRAVVTILVAIAMVLAVFSSNRWLAGINIVCPAARRSKKIEEYSHYLEALLTSVDQLVSMLMTIQLSLFVLAGFALNKRVGENNKASATLIGVGGLFMLTALMSLTLGYTARIKFSP